MGSVGHIIFMFETSHTHAAMKKNVPVEELLTNQLIFKKKKHTHSFCCEKEKKRISFVDAGTSD